MRALWVAAVLLGVVGVAAAQERDRSATGQVLQGGYSAAGAMQSVYGNYDTGSKSSVWEPKLRPKFEERWPAKVRVQVLVDGSYTDAGVTRHVLVTWARPDEVSAGQFTCHACAVVLGVSVFRQDAGGWKVEASALQLAEVGAWGQPPQVKVMQLGGHTWGVAVQTGDMHQGEVEAALWIYGPKAGGFAEWFEADLTDQNPSGAVDAAWCKARQGPMDLMCLWGRIDYALTAVAGKEMYDVARVEKVKNGERQQHWQFNGNQFVRVAAR